MEKGEAMFSFLSVRDGAGALLESINLALDKTKAVFDWNEPPARMNLPE